LDAKLLETARAKIPSIPLLVNVISRRVRQLNAGMRPYVKPLSRTEERVDIALREITEGKLIAELGFFEPTDSGRAPTE